MTIIIPKADAGKTHQILKDIFTEWMFPKVDPQMHTAINQHLAWITSQPHTFVNTKLETLPSLNVTRLTIEISHTQIAPLSTARN